MCADAHKTPKTTATNYNNKYYFTKTTNNMKRKLLLKSLLVAVGLLVGGNVWAGETTTTFDFEDGNTIFTISDAARMSQSIVDDATLNSKVQKLTCGNMNAVAFAYYNFSSLVTDAATVTVEFDFNIATIAGHNLISIADADYHTSSNGGFTGKSNTGYGSNGAIFNLGCYRASGNNKFAINNSQNNLAGLDAWVHAKVVVDNVNKTINYTISKAGETLVSKENVAFLNSSAQKCTQIDVYCGTNAAGNQTLIDNLSIKSYVDDSAVFADYKVVWWDDTANAKIKEETRNAQAGSPISLLAEDIQNFYNSGNTIKYVYVSNDLGEQTVAADGTSVVTIHFTEAGTYDYTVNAIDSENNFLTTLSSGSIFNGDTKTVYWNKYIKVNGQWYVCESPYGITISNAGTQNITFTPSNITYFFDISSMTPSRSQATSASGTWLSNGNGYGSYAGANAYASEVLEAGTYTLYVFSGSRRSGTVTFGISSRKDGTLTDTGKEFTWTVTGTENHEATIEGIVIPAGSQIALVEKTGSNSVAYLDYITLTQTEQTYKNFDIVGDFISGTEEYIWNPENGLEMTQDPNNKSVWTLTLENFSVEGKTYRYKATANNNWTDYELPNGDNQTFTFGTVDYPAGRYDLTFTIDIANNTIGLTAVQCHDYNVAGCYEINNQDFDSFFYTKWDPTITDNNMTRNADGTYEKKFTDVVLDTPGIIRYKVVEDNSWSNNAYPSTDATWGVNEAGTYDITFTFNPTTKDVACNVAIKKEISEAGYATYYSSYGLDFAAAGLEAYIAKLNGTTVKFNKIDDAPNNTGVLLKGAKGTYKLPVIVSTTDVTDNAFVGVLEDTKVAGGIFVLMNGGQGVGFYKTTAEFTVGANTAYLPATAAHAREFIGFGDETTTSINAISNEKMNGEVYNLNGQRVVAPAKGLYIVNGKKVILK